MAESAKTPGLMIVPQGSRSIPESFIQFLVENELGAFLAKPAWAREKESGETGLGLRVAPGSA
jgi:hypothetical protein